VPSSSSHTKRIQALSHPRSCVYFITCQCAHDGSSVPGESFVEYLVRAINKDEGFKEAKQNLDVDVLHEGRRTRMAGKCVCMRVTCVHVCVCVCVYSQYWY